MLLFISATSMATSLDSRALEAVNVKQIEIAPGCQAKFAATIPTKMRTTATRRRRRPTFGSAVCMAIRLCGSRAASKKQT